MTIVAAPTERPEAPLFSDGVGERVVAADGATGELLQILRLRPVLTAVPSFEFALRERAARLANFRHAYYARVRRIDRVPATAGLAIVSDHVEGTRLSDILRVAQERGLQLDINAALCLIRQLVPAVALLHENARDVAHGLIAPERIVVTPHARLLIVEHVVAAAIDQLQFGRERLWQEFRIAMPPSAGAPRFDHRADVNGIGLVALALVLGRPLRADEFPHGIPGVLNEARERSALGEEQPLSPALRTWLTRALQVDVRRAFASAPEALSALDEVLADESAYVAAPVALEMFLSRYSASLLEPPMAAAPPAHGPAASPAPPAPPAQAPARSVVVPAPPVVPAPAAPWPAAPPAPAAVTPAPRPQTPPPPRFDQAPVPVPSLSYAPAPPPAVTFQAAPPPPSVPATPAPPASPVSAAKDLTDLIPVEELDSIAERSNAPLFNPDAPFSLPQEPAPATDPPAPRRSGRSPMKLVALAAGLLIVAAAGLVAPRYFSSGPAIPATPTTMGTLVVQSKPAGVQVFVDGVDRGMTPARLSVTPGAHILELRGRGLPRVIPLQIAAGAQVSQYLEFADTPTTGQLHVQSQPEGARVIVDGTDRGAAPLTVMDLTPGSHEVLLRSDEGTVRHVVNIQAGATASLVAPIGGEAGGGPVSGWVKVKSPFTLSIYEQGRLLGTTDTDRIMMAAGRHDLELVSDALAYRSTRTIQVQPGKVASLTVDLPSGVVNLNASPWAEVWIDGQRVGETPIGNLSVPIGPHEVVFKHPQFGEKRHAISVTLAGPVRLSVDMK
jgi:hypothetical protein